jgi:ribonuclease III
MRELTARVGVELSEKLLLQSLTHRSYAYEKNLSETNERLEFLGDSILGLVITDELFKKFPQASEGELAKSRAAIVNSRALASVGRAIGLGEFIFLGKGEEASGGRDKSSILADAVEALLGAIYLEHGLKKSEEVILRLFSPVIENSLNIGATLDWKTSLAEIVHTKKLGSVDYQIIESGPDHDKSFEAVIKIADQIIAKGEGKSKKTAEQEAAKLAFEHINNQ